MCGAGRCDKHGFTSGWLMSTLSVQGCYHVNWDALALGSPSLPRLRCFVHSSLVLLAFTCIGGFRYDHELEVVIGGSADSMRINLIFHVFPLNS
eukprot:377063-Pelagomonas_calceolata.AAC.1